LCPTHGDDFDGDEPCRGCARARKHRESPQWAEQLRAQARQESEQAAEQRRARQLAARAGPAGATTPRTQLVAAGMDPAAVDAMSTAERLAALKGIGA
jgi:predicted Fe-S protein YdhL (DUF1289 family)